MRQDVHFTNSKIYFNMKNLKWFFLLILGMYTLVGCEDDIIITNEDPDPIYEDSTDIITNPPIDSTDIIIDPPIDSTVIIDPPTDPEEPIDSSGVDVPTEPIDSSDINIPTEPIDSSDIDIPTEPIDSSDVNIPGEPADSTGTGG